jgi:N-formylglutamate deformylase
MLPFTLKLPRIGCEAIPVILDSPHSGTKYPKDFAYQIDIAALRDAEDTHVDLIYGDAPALGAMLLCAEFPRSYVDCNRDAQDIDPILFGLEHDPALLPSKVRLGKGVIWRCLDDGSSIYASTLSVEQAKQRLSWCYEPYWRTLKRMVSMAKRDHPTVVHINCHSMPSIAGRFATEKPGLVHPDIVLGNRDGTTCNDELLQVLKKVCDEFSLDTRINDPYKGVSIVRDIGNPEAGVHSVQIEINRRLYMNETTRDLNDGYERIKKLANALVLASAKFARSQTPTETVVFVN